MSGTGIAALITAITTAFLSMAAWVRGLRHPPTPPPVVAQDVIDNAVEDAIGYFKDIIETKTQEYVGMVTERDRWRVEYERSRHRVDTLERERTKYRRRLAKYEAVDDNGD